MPHICDPAKSTWDNICETLFENTTFCRHLLYLCDRWICRDQSINIVVGMPKQLVSNLWSCETLKEGVLCAQMSARTDQPADASVPSNSTEDLLKEIAVIWFVLMIAMLLFIVYNDLFIVFALGLGCSDKFTYLVPIRTLWIRLLSVCLCYVSNCLIVM